MGCGRPEHHPATKDQITRELAIASKFGVKRWRFVLRTAKQPIFRSAAFDIFSFSKLREFGWVGYSGLLIENYWWGSVGCLRCGATFVP